MYGRGITRRLDLAAVHRIVVTQCLPFGFDSESHGPSLQGREAVVDINSLGIDVNAWRNRSILM